MDIYVGVGLISFFIVTAIYFASGFGDE